MSAIHGKWTSEDIRMVIYALDEKTGMDGADLPICIYNGTDVKALASYTPMQKGNPLFRSFRFSAKYFDNDSFKDSAAIDVIRHEYCHYLVDVLDLKSVFNEDNSHGKAWKTMCHLINVDPRSTYNEWWFRRISSEELERLVLAEDIQTVNIMEQIERWGTDLPSKKRRLSLEKKLIKKYTKKRVFRVGDRLSHEKFGRGVVLDTMPTENKQLLFVEFDSSEKRIIQNRRVTKLSA